MLEAEVLSRVLVNESGPPDVQTLIIIIWELAPPHSYSQQMVRI